MPRNEKPRKKFTCRRIEIPRISEERIDVIINHDDECRILC